MAELPDQFNASITSTAEEYEHDSASISQFLQLECEVEPAGQVKLDGGATSNTCEQCLLCGKFFPYKSTLRYHLRKSHHIVTDGLDDINYFQQKKCDICQAQFTLKEELVQHLQLAHTHKNSQNLFECELCQDKFTHKHKIRHHVMNTHFPETTNQQQVEDIKLISCLLCTPKVKFQSEQSFISHFNQNHTVNKCHNCGRNFIKKGTLFKHILQCFKMFGHIEEHKYDLPDQFVLHICPFCRLKVKNLSTHMDKCKCLPLKSPDYVDIKSSEECPVCRTVVNVHSNNIKNHVLECNLKLGAKKGYKIVKTNQIYYEYYEIVNHEANIVKSKQKQTEDIKKINKEVENKISKHMCGICDQQMETTQLEFLNHLQRCTAMKKLEDVTYKCKLCGRYFMMSGKNSLEKHIKSCQFSKKLKSFLCTTCKFVFASKGDFKGHLEFCSKILPTKSGSLVVGISHQSADTHTTEFCKTMRLIHKTKFSKDNEQASSSSHNNYETVFIKSEVDDNDYLGE